MIYKIYTGYDILCFLHRFIDSRIFIHVIYAYLSFIIIDIKNEIVKLFYDGKLPYNKIRSNLFLTHFFQLYQELADIKGISTSPPETPLPPNNPQLPNILPKDV